MSIMRDIPIDVLDSAVPALKPSTVPRPSRCRRSLEGQRGRVTWKGKVEG